MLSQSRDVSQHFSFLDPPYSPFKKPTFSQIRNINSKVSTAPNLQPHYIHQNLKAPLPNCSNQSINHHKNRLLFLLFPSKKSNFTSKLIQKHEFQSLYNSVFLPNYIHQKNLKPKPNLSTYKTIIHQYFKSTMNQASLINPKIRLIVLELIIIPRDNQLFQRNQC